MSTSPQMIYVSAPWTCRDEAGRVIQRFRDAGYVVPCDWTHEDEGAIKTPSGARIIASRDLLGVGLCDAFVMLTVPRDGGGLGMYVELGYAVACQKLMDEPLIFVVGEHNTDSPFYFLSGILRVSSVDDVLLHLKKEGEVCSK